ncbi:MAG TPA: hypothetical protein VNT99_13555 [Methylomirabilota bacterium]|nr:hypothetical protein [Methylomirabilota bacterium]
MYNRNSHTRLRRSLRAALIGVMAFFALLATSIAAAAEEGEYKPPAGGVYEMEAHLKWCGNGKTAGTRIKRYEQFWSLQSPKESDGYDASHPAGAALRLSAGGTLHPGGTWQDCLKMLKFLEKEDETFKVEQEG